MPRRTAERGGPYLPLALFGSCSDELRLLEHDEVALTVFGCMSKAAVRAAAHCGCSSARRRSMLEQFRPGMSISAATTPAIRGFPYGISGCPTMPLRLIRLMIDVKTSDK